MGWFSGQVVQYVLTQQKYSSLYAYSEITDNMNKRKCRPAKANFKYLKFYITSEIPSLLLSDL